MARIMNTNEYSAAISVKESFSTRKADAEKLAKEAKRDFAKGDMESAARNWCAIYDLYEGDTSTDGFAELNGIMSMFTDDEVYGITDWMKENSINESEDFSKILDGIFRERKMFGNDDVIKVGDEVMWYPNQPGRKPSKAKIETITLSNEIGGKYGRDVKQAKGSQLDYCTFTLDNWHWCYGEQIGPLP